MLAIRIDREIGDEETKVEQTNYKITSAMKKLDVCRATIYRMAARGEIDIVKLRLRCTTVTAESIERAIAAGRVSRK